MSFRAGIFILLLCGSWPSAQALEQRYIASFDASSWELTESSSILCRISHQIPGFGSARFTRQAGRGLQFELLSQRRFQKGINVELRSEAGYWDKRQLRAVLARFETSGSRRLFSIPEAIAERSFNELTQGYQPGFLFYDDSPLVASLSNVRFGEVATKFAQCINQLYHQNFDDVRLSSIFFEPDNEFASLAQEDSAFVDMMEYLQIDNAISEIVVTGHADKSGSVCYNDALSERRAWYVYDLLIAQGIDPALLRIDYQGERQNSSAGQKSKSKQALAVNRRVTVEMVR